MSDDQVRVWISRRKCKKRTTYHLRWIDPAVGKMRSKKAGTDRKHAEREAALLEEKLNAGTYQEIRRIRWSDFVDEVVTFLSGTHAEEARRTLTEFGTMCSPTSPRMVRPSMIRKYVQGLREKGNVVAEDDEKPQERKNSVATISKKLRYLRLAFRTAIKLDYAAKNPLDGWTWEKVNRAELRILTADEETKLLKAAEELHGYKLWAFIRFTLETWGRLSEVTKLRWADVHFDDASIYFRSTKSHEDRFIPVAPESGLLDVLRRLQAMTLQDGGPFLAYGDRSNFAKKWNEVVEAADIPPITRHDLRRTGITRALLAGVPPAVVQELAGHKDIKTTMRYYAQVSRQDLRDAVSRIAVG
ncbi:MAG: site-specific integrase [Phycisphaerales bacterium]|nr:MAG: site-specific integrase [Phycisphaerales bacterium]